MNTKMKMMLDVSSANTGILMDPATSVATSNPAGDYSIGAKIAGQGERKGAAGIEKAVYAYIRALRALGRTKVGTVEIARALDIPMEEVVNAITTLKAKGVKVAA
jgi:hypothetical protein